MTNIFQHVLPGCFLLMCLGCSDVEPADEPKYRYELSIYVDNILRSYVVNLPGSYYDAAKDSRLYPLVIALHGTGGSARQMETDYGLNEKASESNFVVVYPEGVRSNGPLGIRTWNAGKCCDYAMENNINDVGFIRNLIDRTVGDYNINPKRVYVTGMSNGGMMAYRLACEAPDKIAAIAPVSATMIVANTCQPTRPVPILHLHSLADTKVPYRGGEGIGHYYFPPVDSVLNSWSQKNRCTDTPIVNDNGLYMETTWTNCAGDISMESYATYDGGHSWPGGKQTGIWADPPSAYIDANDLIWNFFQRFELP